MKTKILFLLLLFNVTEGLPNGKEYIDMHILMNKAKELYDHGMYIKSHNKLEKLIEIDNKNYYWESYLLLAKIYNYLGNADSAKNILLSGIKKGSIVLNSKIEYLNLLHKLDSSLVVENNGSIMSDIHIFPDQRSYPKNGWEYFKTEILKFTKKQKNIEKLYISLIVDKTGRLARIDIKDQKTFNNIILPIEFYYKIFMILWKPAKYGVKNIDSNFAFSLKNK